MNPYQTNPYAVGHGQPQQRQQYQTNQLPPMYAGGGGAPPPPMAPPPAPAMGQSGAAQPVLYPTETANQIPGPGQSRLDNAPKSQIGNNGKYKFELVVEQQPQRARMCGFGDKDRRPITPPPCVRLIITDAQTGKTIAPGDEMDGMFFVLQVDLWDDSATREVNIVRSSSAAPSASISMATTTSFPPTPLTPQTMAGDYPPGMYQAVEVPSMYGQQGGYHPMGMGRPSVAGPGQMYSNVATYAGYAAPQQFGSSPIAVAPYPSPSYQSQQTNSHNMYTRNLIGSLTVNASQLKDLSDELGFWFVLQDLSIRTEGMFR